MSEDDEEARSSVTFFFFWAALANDLNLVQENRLLGPNESSCDAKGLLD